MSVIVQYYRKTDPLHSLLLSIKEGLHNVGLSDESAKIEAIETENCFNVQIDGEISPEQEQRLEWLLSETFEPEKFSSGKSFLESNQNTKDFLVFEFGPRMTFTSAFSSNAVSICQSCSLPISRLELSRRYRFKLSSALSIATISAVKSLLHDKMTEEEYPESLKSFDSGNKTEPVRYIPVMEKGRAALEEINESMGLGFDDFDLDYYTKLFQVRYISFSCSLLLARSLILYTCAILGKPRT